MSTLIYMNHRIKTPQGRGHGKCIDVLEDLLEAVACDKVMIHDREGNLVAVIKCSVQATPLVKTHNVHAWIEVSNHGYVISQVENS